MKDYFRVQSMWVLGVTVDVRKVAVVQTPSTNVINATTCSLTSLLMEDNYGPHDTFCVVQLSSCGSIYRMLI